MCAQLGKVSGSVTTSNFSFDADARIKKLDYITVKDPEGRWVLALIDSIVRNREKIIAKARVIGYRDLRGFLRTPKIPFAPDTPIYSAQPDFIQKILGIAQKGLYIGLLDGYDIKVNLPVDHVVKKHIAILAKTGAGKSYAAAVLLEELAEQRIPIVVLDPHGEYSSLAVPNSRQTELKIARKFDIKPKGYRDQLQVFGVQSGRQIKFSSRMTMEEVVRILPAKISASQKGLLYSACRDVDEKNCTLKNLIQTVRDSKSEAKWNLVSMLQGLDETKLFSLNPTPLTDIVSDGRISIIDFQEARPEIQQIVSTRLIEDLFLARKADKIPPFLLVVEEAHNFCPERGFGEVPSSKILRTIASEGRKFGLGLCIISQRPARVDKSILSQCNTQIILKVTNPNDLRAITESIEGIGQETKDELKDLPIGIALISGVTDHPIVTDIRIRRSQHGGEGAKVSVEPEKISIFQPLVSQKEIENRFKGIESLTFLNYPLWKIHSKFKGHSTDVYIDGITGEMLLQKGMDIQKTTGLSSVLKLSEQERSVVLQLARRGPTTPEQLSHDLRFPLSTIQSISRQLIKDNIISSGDYTLQNAVRLPRDISESQISLKPIEQMPDMLLDFSVPEENAKETVEIFGFEPVSAAPVYYPFWLFEHRKKKMIVDGISGQIDLEATKTINDLI